ncbi:Hsp70 family protein [Prosthecobacter sp.]|uniref:Hsp70 family protein n=1 Tax=Prosthecobacter sp. TaxID=1965333 RepID=UPI003783A911
MIGIDLGTTNSLVAVCDDTGPRVISNELGEDLTPSVVAVAEDGTILVGRAARDRLITAPDSGRAFFKRDMGTTAGYHFGGRRWTPVECSALILREMKRIAELQLGREITSSVITVPAYFHDQQRQATVDAAKIAGLKVERLLNEPTAAALAYGFNRQDDLSTLLVFDLGGGTFDVTVLECFDGVVEVKASSGDGRLGGEDYTDAFTAWVTKELGYTAPADQQMKWRNTLEHLKRKLTTEETVDLQIGDKNAPVTRTDFIEATKHITARLWPAVRRALNDAQLTPKQIEAVLLVGGASRMPAVQEMVLRDLGQEAQRSLDPDRVVALGAAVQQALCAGGSAVKDLVLTDVCPHSLGVEVAKALLPGHSQPGYFDPILDRNTTVPVSRIRTYYTMHPQQDEALLKVYQGESRLTKDNHLIGQLRIPGLRCTPEQKDGGTFDVRFTYDMNGILEVEVTIRTTQKKLTEVFEQRPGTMSREQIAEALRKLTPLKVHPREAPANRARLERAQRLFAELVGVLRDSLSQELDIFESALETQDSKIIATAAMRLDAFMRPYFANED